VNTAKTFTYPVLKPGPGCDMGKREPHLRFTAEQQSRKGVWEPVTLNGGAGCGLYGVGVKDEVVELKPGEKLAITGEGFRGHFHQFQYPGLVRMTGHYDYLVGETKGPLPRQPVAGMRGAPPFALVSNPVEFDVIPELELKLTAKRVLKAGVEYTLSDILDVTLTNNTDAPVPVRTGARIDPRLTFWVGKPQADNPAVTAYADVGATAELKPGETLPVLGAGAMANGADGKWTVPEPGKYPLRATFAVGRDFTEQPRTIEAWTEITVEK
jgi:hypothetical protein